MNRSFLFLTVTMLVLSPLESAAKRLVTNPIGASDIVNGMSAAQCLQNGGTLKNVSKRICIKQQRCHLQISTDGQTRDICIGEN